MRRGLLRRCAAACSPGAYGYLLDRASDGPRIHLQVIGDLGDGRRARLAGHGVISRLRLRRPRVRRQDLDRGLRGEQLCEAGSCSPGRSARRRPLDGLRGAGPDLQLGRDPGPNRGRPVIHAASNTIISDRRPRWPALRMSPLRPACRSGSRIGGFPPVERPCSRETSLRSQVKSPPPGCRTG
jgi:hypothetical protein